MTNPLMPPTTSSDNAKPWEPPPPFGRSKQCQQCGYDKHEEDSSYKLLQTYDIPNCCGVCRTAIIENGDDGLELYCGFNDDQEPVGHYNVCDAICRLFPWEIRDRFEL